MTGAALRARAPAAAVAAVMMTVCLPGTDALAANGGCPVTLPNGNGPPAEAPLAHGNGALATALWPDGIVRPRPEWVHADGAIDVKWPWYRLTVEGELEIIGRRLDDDAPPLVAEIAAGYGDTGFQATGLRFSSGGCWEVTARVGSASLSFVTFVAWDTGSLPDTSLAETDPGSSRSPDESSRLHRLLAWTLVLGLAIRLAATMSRPAKGR